MGLLDLPEPLLEEIAQIVFSEVDHAGWPVTGSYVAYIARGFVEPARRAMLARLSLRSRRGVRSLQSLLGQRPELGAVIRTLVVYHICGWDGDDDEEGGMADGDDQADEEDDNGYDSLTSAQLSAVIALAPQLHSLDLQDGMVARINEEAIGCLARIRLASLTLRGDGDGLDDEEPLKGSCALLWGVRKTLESVTIDGELDGDGAPPLPRVVQLHLLSMPHDVAARIVMQCPSLLRLASLRGVPDLTDAACGRLTGLEVSTGLSSERMRRFTSLRFVRLLNRDDASLIDALPDSLVEIECPGGFQRRLIVRLAAQPPQLTRLTRLRIDLSWFKGSEASRTIRRRSAASSTPSPSRSGASTSASWRRSAHRGASRFGIGSEARGSIRTDLSE